MNARSTHLDAVLFDMDGVLVDSTASHVAAWSRFLDERGIEHPDEGIPSLFGRRAVDAVASLLGVDPDGVVARSAVGALERYADELMHATPAGACLTRGAAQLVSRLAEDGWQLAVATSARRAAVEHSLGSLLAAFGTVVSAEDVRFGKPDPEVYLTAAARLAVPPQAASVVEDAPAGVRAGRRALMQVIGITSTTTRERLLDAGADVVVDDLAEVLPIVEAHRQQRRDELAGGRGQPT